MAADLPFSLIRNQQVNRSTRIAGSILSFSYQFKDMRAPRILSA